MSPVEDREARDQKADATTSSQRQMDLAIAIIALAVSSPVMMLVALAICIETGRPIFYSQTRIGRGGRRFRIHKFRKFHKDARAGCPLTVEHDPRMTRIGSFLARTKLDELPQLWNVVVGEMSIVGPRPESSRLFGLFHRIRSEAAGLCTGYLRTQPGCFPKRVLTLSGELGSNPVLSRGALPCEGQYRPLLLSASHGLV